MNFKGAARPRTAGAYASAAALLGCEVAAIKAVVDVEAGGSGFDRSGRPKMLFEPHVFYRQLSGPQRVEAVKQGLAYSHWKPGAYPADSYPRLIKACAINETAALKAASWGACQILGENYAAAGYVSPQAMVADFIESEDAQIAAMARFIKARGLADKLRRKDWAGFARGYNGAGYAANTYDKKIAAAYARHAREPAEAAPRTSTPAPAGAGTIVGTATAGGTVIAAGAAKAAGVDWTIVVIGAAAVLVAAIVIFVILKKLRRTAP